MTRILRHVVGSTPEQTRSGIHKITRKHDHEAGDPTRQTAVYHFMKRQVFYRLCQHVSIPSWLYVPSIRYHRCVRIDDAYGSPVMFDHDCIRQMNARSTEMKKQHIRLIRPIYPVVFVDLFDISVISMLCNKMQRKVLIGVLYVHKM